jgi:hypothetical protein
MMMEELVILNHQLPSTLDDLTKFVLVGREKLVSVRAEIRAIDKLNLAQEVRDQKRDEARMLSEALLDAEVRLGELLKQIPRQVGGRPSEKTTESAFGSLEKPKHEIVGDLGFTEKQKEAFEKLADNKDLVEQVKEEARENDDIPTRSRVLDLAKKRNQVLAKVDERPPEIKEYDEYMDECHKSSNAFIEAMSKFYTLSTTENDFKMWVELVLDDKMVIENYIHEIEIVLPKVLAIRKFLRGIKK